VRLKKAWEDEYGEWRVPQTREQRCWVHKTANVLNDLQNLRTTNPIESTFATVRLRTNKTKGCGSRLATLTMVFKLSQSASKSWRRLTGAQLLADVIQGAIFHDGIKSDAAA